MTKIVTAEYDAAAKALRLAEPLEGVADHAKVQVTVETAEAGDAPWWEKYRGALTKEAGEDLARAIDEMFPPWNADE